MSRMVIRPPAARFHVEPQQGPLGGTQTAPLEYTTIGRGGGSGVGVPHRDVARQSFGAVDQSKGYGSSDTTQLPIGTVRQDVVQVNPATEQPRLVFYSGAQPFIRWGVRQFHRTHMTAGPRFQGRWAYVGFIERHYTERARITGNPSRLGRTYTLAQVRTGPGPRAIQLGGG